MEKNRKCDHRPAKSPPSHRTGDWRLDSLENGLPDDATLFRSTTENIDWGMAFINCRHEIVRINSVEAAYFHKTPDALIGKKCYREFEKRAEICPHCPGVQAIRSGRPAEVETSGVRDDGQQFAVRVKAIPMFDDAGNAIGFIELVEDISERKKAEAQLHELAAKLTEKNIELRKHAEALEAATRAKNDFLANVSHELRTPLNAVLGFSESLLHRADVHPLNDHQKDRIARIKEAGEHLLTMIDNLLDTVRLESGKIQLNISTFSVGAVADEVAEVVGLLLRDKPAVRFSIDIDERLPSMVSDIDKVRAILTNLASNAVKYTERGLINIRIRRRDKSLVIEVKDTGVGIAAENMTRVFEKFFQAPTSVHNTLRGAGLGLPICKSYAEALGGTINAMSVEGTGSVFTVTLPLVAAGKTEQRSRCGDVASEA